MLRKGSETTAHVAGFGWTSGVLRPSDTSKASVCGGFFIAAMSGAGDFVPEAVDAQMSDWLISKAASNQYDKLAKIFARCK